MRATQRFKLLIDSITDHAIFLLDSDGHVISWNTGAHRITGYASEEIIGRHFACFHAEEDRNENAPQRDLQCAVAEGRFTQEGWRLRKDGSRFWAEVTSDAVRDDESGALTGFVTVIRDLTERLHAAEALEQTHTRLMQGQRMEALGQLTDGIAHDFNNVLAVIVNCLDLLAPRLQAPSQIAFLEKAQRAANRGATLTRQLLAFARRQALKPDRHDLNLFIGGFEGILRRTCPASIDFRLDLKPRLYTVYLDGQQFETALLNLVANARDAMPRGGKLTLVTENVEITDFNPVHAMAPGPYVRVALSDTGHGMTSDVLRRAFEPFFTTREPGMGRGLGLSQVYGFVVQSGGKVVIESEVDSGTIVNMYFPAIPAAAGALDLSDDPEAMQVGEKVLIVEDDPDVLDVSVQIFHSMGYQVLTAENGLEAIDILKRIRDIDVLFTDVVMPMGMSGIELARFTRKLCPGIDTILASGYPLAVLTSEHGALDDFAFISKPFRWTELLETIRRVRKKRE